MAGHETRIIQLVRVIDALVRPVIETDPALLATWENVVALPRLSKVAVEVVPTLAGSTQPAASSETGEELKAAA